MYGRAADWQHTGSLFPPALVQVVSTRRGAGLQTQPGLPHLGEEPAGRRCPRRGSQGWMAGDCSPQPAGSGGLAPGAPRPPALPSSRAVLGQGRGERAPEPGEGALVHTLRNRQGNFQNQIQKTSLGVLQTMFGAIFILFFSAFWSCAFGRPGEAAVACRCLQCCVMSPGAAFQNRKDAEFSPEQKSGVNALTY